MNNNTRLINVQKRYERIHTRLMQDNPIYSFIRENVPADDAEPVFFEYCYVTACVGMIPNEGNKTIATAHEEQRDFVEGMLDNCFEFLWEDCGIAVQRAAVNGSFTGIRIMNIA